MKNILLLLATIAFVFGGVPRERFDPCIFIDCSKFTTTQPTTIKVTSPSKVENAQNSEELEKIKTKLVCHECIKLSFRTFSPHISLLLG